jgi:hypothetical protein
MLPLFMLGVFCWFAAMLLLWHECMRTLVRRARCVTELIALSRHLREILEQHRL